jgi:hypothetical protein
MGNHWSSNVSVHDLSKEELIDLVEQICQNGDVDIMTQARWQDMSVEQLRTIVVLLDDDMIDILDARRRRSVTTSPYAGCSLLKSLYDYTKGFPNGLELQTQRVITNHQRIQIAAAYMASLTPAERLEEEQGVVEDQESYNTYDNFVHSDISDDEEDNVVRRSGRLQMQRLRQEAEAIGNFRRLGVRWEVDADPFEERMIRSAHDPQFIENEYPRLSHLYQSDRERELFFMHYYNTTITNGRGTSHLIAMADVDWLVWRYLRASHGGKPTHSTCPVPTHSRRTCSFRFSRGETR